MPPTSHRTKFFRHEYTVGWLCAVSEVELPAAMQMLDVFHEYPYDPVPGSDENTYTFGSINGHNVVIACLPPNSPGKVSAARLVAPLSQSFTNMKVHLFVGIGAGIPRTPSTTDAKKNIHLGDVVVGWPAETGSPVIVQYDFRYAESSDVGAQRLLGRDQTPDRRLLSVLGQLLAEYSIQRTKFPKIEESLNEDFQHPGLEHDRLYKSEYIHPNSKIDCSNCDSSQVVDRPKRQTKDFVFHRGTILSGDSFVAGADFRDKLANAHNTALCIEMEASGVIDQTRCLVIRGICDYADTHVNRIWQKYAAGTAAVFAKQFLHTLQPQAIEKFDAIPIIVKQPADRDKGFTARDDILEEIEAKFKSEHLVGLTGVGGVGKSHIALEYFHRFSNCKEFRDCSAIWIPSRTRARFIAEYRKLAENIGLKTLPDQAPKEVVRLVNDWLCQQDNEWLLVIDDAQFEISPPEDANSSGSTRAIKDNWLYQYLPEIEATCAKKAFRMPSQSLESSRTSHPTGNSNQTTYTRRILFTSSDQEMIDSLLNYKVENCIHIDPLSKEDAVTLAKTKFANSRVQALDSQDPEYAQISQLVELLGRIPLAIVQAVAIIKSRQTVSISSFIERWNHFQEELVNQNQSTIKRGGETTKAISYTWQLSLEQIQITNPSAVGLLSLMCFLDPTGITEDLFTNDPKSPGITDEMEPLLRLSLVSPLQKLETKERSSDFQMIALVQAAIISWLRSENRFEASLETVLKVLSTKFEEGEFSNENQWKRYSALVPHVDKVLRDFPPTKSNSDEMNSYRARLLRAYTKYLWRQGQLHQLENLCDQATNFHRDYIKDPRLLLQCEALKGSFYQSTGDLKKAEEVQSKVLSRREEKFGRDDPDTLSSRNDLAQVLRNRGELKRAKKEFREAFRGRRRKLGPENKYTLDSMSDLGQILCDLKQIPEAERRTQRALKLKKEHLGPQHPSTLATMLQLGHINAFKKDPEHIEAAKKLYQDAFDGFTAALGAEHRDTLIAQSYLADLLLQQKSPRDAGIIYSKVLAVSEKTFGDLDPETLTTMVYLATALRRDKDPRGAEEYYRKAFGKMVEMEKKLGVKHISLLVCLNGFIKVLQELVSSGSLNEEEKLSLSKELQELTTYREEYKATRSNLAGKRSQNHTGDARRAHYLPFFMRFLGYISTWNTEYKLF
ncbi:hypothetical protein TWF106_007892 [Orbilia oligospora]|uniref:Uncharacterized protein n=1 Tax=Orbilia oligospora TaxID=2813651 RepID=A0A7C8UX82_ORBOL|nr:hypothetical protein TWF106_007892 [Orbilia oligospora]